MGKSIKDYPVRVTKKGKKRGRPSKQEKTMSALLSWFTEKPENKEAIQMAVLDAVIYGKGVNTVGYKSPSPKRRKK